LEQLGATIRYHEPQERATAGADAATAPALVGRSVLITLGNDCKGAALAEIVRADGLAVLTCRPAEAISLAQAHCPSVVILDESGGRGALRDVCRSIRALGGTYGQEVPIILLTSEHEGGHDEMLGISDRLVEPFSPSYARTRVRAWLMRIACRWVRPPTRPDEEERLAALARLAVLDTPREERFDRITRIAAEVFDAPVALLTLVDRERQWFQSHHGAETRESPLDVSFCGHAVFDRKPLIVPDTLLDDRFADNPVVTGEPRVRSYAGFPLILSDGHCVGTLCVLDFRPRNFDEKAIGRLHDLAAVALSELERHRPKAA
jgi:DNA-binding response OmpR family regulator